MSKISQIFIALPIIFMTIFSGCTQESTTTTTSVLELPSKKTPPPALESDDSIYQRAINSRDISICDSTSLDSFTKQCIFDITVLIAIDENDSSVCQQLEDFKQQEQCLFQIQSQ